VRWLQVPRFEPTVRQASELRQTVGGNIADLRRVGKSASGLVTPIPDTTSLWLVAAAGLTRLDHRRNAGLPVRLAEWALSFYEYTLPAQGLRQTTIQPMSERRLHSTSPKSCLAPSSGLRCANSRRTKSARIWCGSWCGRRAESNEDQVRY
jgi:hypothetical protein